MFEFLDIAEVAVSSMTYHRELKFHKFLQLWPESRLNVENLYVHESRELQKYIHSG